MALVAGEPYRSVANRYESLSQASVQRHERESSARYARPGEGG